MVKADSNKLEIFIVNKSVTNLRSFGMENFPNYFFSVRNVGFIFYSVTERDKYGKLRA